MRTLGSEKVQRDTMVLPISGSIWDCETPGCPAPGGYKVISPLGRPVFVGCRYHADELALKGGDSNG